MDLQKRIESAISSSTGVKAHFSESRASYGGCINDSRIVILKDGRQFFIKTHNAAHNMPGIFESEYEALLLLSEPEAIHVPRPVTYGEDFLVMERFVEGSPAADWQEQMGRGLAKLHIATKQDRFGFNRDNYLGTTKQINTWQENWLEFWREQRLAWQLRLFSTKTDTSDPLLVLGEKLLQGLDELIGTINEPAVFLHGDLWSGNAAANEKGEPVIYDPASYYGHREAEIGMMRMFGGFGPRCEAAYAEVWPFEAGLEQRVSLYRLYHELNHLNLFGRSYYQSCLSTIQSLL